MFIDKHVWHRGSCVRCGSQFCSCARAVGAAREWLDPDHLRSRLGLFRFGVMRFCCGAVDVLEFVLYDS